MAADGSFGTLVPNPPSAPAAATTSETTDATTAAAAVAAAGVKDRDLLCPICTGTIKDRDLLCPICMGTIRDAFLTACGHSFCYMCIVTHLQNKSDCPCCAHYLTKDNIYPNFLLNKFNELKECYLQKRHLAANQIHNQEERGTNTVKREGYLEDFQSVLATFTRYSRLRVIAELRHGDLSHTADIVSSIEFDQDDELFATAGVSKQIKVFDFSTVVNEPAEVHCPVAEMSTQSKLSCLSWNKYSKNIIASSDYEGVVTVWDVNTRQSVMEYKEHEKRAWSVDFSHTEPTMLVSGSDDCKVKVWCTKQEASVFNIDMKANICCVKYNPGSSFHVAVGSADHHVHYFDLRNTSTPLHVFKGHRKAVSYVRFLSVNELASASTDNTLRLWDVKENCAVRTFRGHTNEKNFVGLAVNDEYFACGSETNEVFVYHKAIPKTLMWHQFSSPESEDTDDDFEAYFISAVCWKSDSPTMLAANSQGTIKVLVLDV